MPSKVIASAWPDEPSTTQLTWDHPLAVVAARNCQEHSTPLVELLGGVACGGCWSDALYTDYVFAKEHGLPLDLVLDPFDIDEIAVDRAVSQVIGASNYADAVELAFDSLTELERAEAKRQLAAIRNQRNRSYQYVCSKAAAARREVRS